MAKAIVAITTVLFVVFAETGKAADLSESYTFRQDGSEYTTTLVIKQKDLASEAR